MAPRLLLLVLLAVLRAGLCLRSGGADDYFPVDAEAFTVDLAELPGRRWDGLPAAYCERLRGFVPDFKETYILRLFGSEEKYAQAERAVQANVMLPQNSEFLAELGGLASKCAVSLEFIAMYNFMYEFGILAGCTAIAYVGGDKALLSSNLDYGFHKLFSEITFHAKYVRGSRVLFEARQIFGFVGFITAASETYSATLNARTWKQQISLDDLISRIGQGNVASTVYTFRKAFEERRDYQGFVDAVSNNALLAPAYYTVADHESREATVLTVSFGARPTADSLDSAGAKWFLVQTNADRQVNDLRRTVAESKMAPMSADDPLISKKIEEEVLAVPPNFSILHDRDGRVRSRTISTSSVTFAQGFVFKVLLWKKRYVHGSDSRSEDLL